MVGPLQDDVSAVTLLDHMGSDLTVVNAARVSFAKEVGYLAGRDEGLIRYLARNGHWTPFSQGVASFRIKMPIFVARQWFRHEVGFTRNETSRRYVDEEPDFYYPKQWRGRPEEGIKQGSGGALAHPQLGIEADGVLARAVTVACDAYAALLVCGVAPEMARVVLPQSMYTEFIETASLYAYARLCRLRLDPHAQWEVRQYAEAVSTALSPLFPVSWAALMEVR